MGVRPVIGLEVHMQVKTASKVFCGCATSFGAAPNSHVCPVCLGFPGTLPVLNRKVLEAGIRVALGVDCKIQPKLVFHRKNYYYPDLPKGYQISQFDLPLGTDGVIKLPEKKIRILRVHMEEDAGKLLHQPEKNCSLVDFNRGGIPLLEIVTQPDITSPEQAYLYLKTLKGILIYLGVSDCDMEKGSLRCDANVSLSPESDDPDKPTGVRVEIKNLNSFKAVSQSLAFEIKRQGELLAAGEAIDQETRLWEDGEGVTKSMRSKEYAHDYRYFPEPDLVPFSVSEKEVERIRETLPELPRARAQRFQETYQLPVADAAALTASKETADYYETAVGLLSSGKAEEKAAASLEKGLSNWILGDLAREMNDRNLEDISALKFPAEHLVELVQLIASGKISSKMAKEVFLEALKAGQAPAQVVEAKGMAQVTDRGELESAAQAVIAEHAKAVADFKTGKEQALMFLVGQLMRKTRGAASPDLSQEVLRGLLTKGE